MEQGKCFCGHEQVLHNAIVPDVPIGACAECINSPRPCFMFHVVRLLAPEAAFFNQYEKQME